MIIKQEFLKKGHALRPGLPMNNPTAIVLSWTTSSLSDIIRNENIIPHYAIKDDQVFQYVPEHEVAKHSSDKSIYCSISIKFVSAERLTQESIDALKELLDKLPKRELLRSKTECSEYYMNNDNWNNLLEELR